MPESELPEPQEPVPCTFKAVLYEKGAPVVTVELSDHEVRNTPLTALGIVESEFLEWLDAAIMAGSF